MLNTLGICTWNLVLETCHYPVSKSIQNIWSTYQSTPEAITQCPNPCIQGTGAHLLLPEEQMMETQHRGSRACQHSLDPQQDMQKDWTDLGNFFNVSVIFFIILSLNNLFLSDVSISYMAKQLLHLFHVKSKEPSYCPESTSPDCLSPALAPDSRESRYQDLSGLNHFPHFLTGFRKGRLFCKGFREPPSSTTQAKWDII